MWPWEHAVVGYVSYSLFCRAYFRRPPDGRETVVVVFASVLPDLVDKPLAWEFGVLPSSGYAVGHSVFVATPLAVAAGIVTRWWGASGLGLAFGFGSLLHLLGDVVPISLGRGELTIRHLLWPLVRLERGRPHASFLDGVRHNLGPYAEGVLALEPTPHLGAQLAIAGVALCLWIADGTPGLRAVTGGLRRSCTLLRRRLTGG